MHITSTVLNHSILYGDTRNQRKIPCRSSGHLTVFGNFFSLATKECVRNVTKIPLSKCILTLSSDPMFDSARLSEYC